MAATLAVLLTPAFAQAQTFAYTGQEQTYIVPAGVTELHVVAAGGGGGGSYLFSCPPFIGCVAQGGPGATVSADLPVSQQQTLFLEVGGGGSSDGTPGWNGGGAGGPGAGPGGGGGGASDIRTESIYVAGTLGSLPSRLLVAGGGGGVAAPEEVGGSAGADGGGGAAGGKAGTASAGGLGGAGCGRTLNAAGPGFGGTGQWFSTGGGNGGGGGGGGYYGGGGGGAWSSTCTSVTSAGGGGGGSSFVEQAGSNVSVSAHARGPGTDGQITLTAPVPTDPSGSSPVIGSQVVVGQTVSVTSHADWSSSPPVSGYRYQWERCDSNGAPASCQAISGATGYAYTLTSGDLGSTVRVAEAASNFYGTGQPATSAPSGVIGEAPFDSAPPTISGTPLEGMTLTEGHGVWSNSPSSFAYSWLRCDASGGSCQPTGQTGTSYGLSPEDIGHTVRVGETAGNQWGIAATALSPPAGPVLDVPVDVQSFALVGIVRSNVPGPVASFTGDRSVPISDYSAKITWGDGSTGKGRVVNGTLGNYLVQASHVYGKQGNYTMTVRVSSTTGVVAQSINRVSVFTASVCPKRSATRGRNCLGQIAFAPGCVIAGAKLEVNIPSSASIKQVSYAIDGSRKVIRGTGPHFRAGLPTAGLRDGTHQLTARVTFRSGRPRTVSKNRPFAVC